MYVNQIDNIIDEILDKFGYQMTVNDQTFKIITEQKKKNFVEYQHKINNFLENYIKSIELSPLQKLLNNKENIQLIIDIIKRYIAYYYFLTIAYHYTGTLKEFRSNLIQYSKLQENETFTIKNFFDTENNYQVIVFFKIIKDTSQIILMSDLQKKTLNYQEVKESIDFLNGLGTDYINNYLVQVASNGDVSINVHNLIKTIVFGEIYRNQEQIKVFNILNEQEENEKAYIYIDIVVTSEDFIDYQTFNNVFAEDTDMDTDMVANDLYELIRNEKLGSFESRVSTLNTDNKNNELLQFYWITPIVDDFIRFHRDSERLENDVEKNFLPIRTANADNVKMAIIMHQKKKKENTKAQIIVNKLDLISELYSDVLQKDPVKLADVKKLFNGPLSHRKGVTFNYREEVHFMNKILNMGRKVIENNEYFLELRNINSNAYFNFKEFSKYGLTVNLNIQRTINLLRHVNIEFQSQIPKSFVELHTGINDTIINITGLSIGPFDETMIQCTKKEELLDIRKISINYTNRKKVRKTLKTDNGVKIFLKIVKYFIINTIIVTIEPNSGRLRISIDQKEIREMNPDTFSHVIYWLYDIKTDRYVSDTVDNVKVYNFQEIIRQINAHVYEKVFNLLLKRLYFLIQSNLHLDYFTMQTLIEYYSNLTQLHLSNEEKRYIIIEKYLKMKKPDNTLIENPESASQVFSYKLIFENKIHKIKINMSDPFNIHETNTLTLGNKALGKDDEYTYQKCPHEDELNNIDLFKKHDINRYNSALTNFIDKYSIQTKNTEFTCRVCGEQLPIHQFVQDGTYDNNNEKFITAYIPIYIPLEELREYKKFQKNIKYLEKIIERLSLITQTTIYIGTSMSVAQKKKALIKMVLDIIVKHNETMMKKNLNELSEILSKKFGMSTELQELSLLLFFELDDNVFDFTHNLTSPETADFNRLKFNNILMYLVMMFMTELNGSQIAMMTYDRICNIFVYEKFGIKLFNGLMLKKNINANDYDTVSITKYPVLCYLIFNITYFLIIHKLFFIPSKMADRKSKSYNLAIQKSLIISIVELINTISLEAGKKTGRVYDTRQKNESNDDNIYAFITGKFYSQLNSLFKNEQVIKILKQKHIKYTTDQIKKEITIDMEKLKAYPIDKPIEYIPPLQKIRTTKMSNGMDFHMNNNIMYHISETFTPITNCPSGDFHSWEIRKGDLVCTKCNMTLSEAEKLAETKPDSIEENYYFVLGLLANKRCLDGRQHDFIGKNGEFICNLCGRKKNDKYSHEELNKLVVNMNSMLDNQISANFKKQDEFEKSLEKKETDDIAIIQKIEDSYNKYVKKEFGRLEEVVNKFIDKIEDVIGIKTDMGSDKYPVYLRDDVYIIDHLYDGSIPPEPIIYTDSDKKIIFQDHHPVFDTDVYYYIDNRKTSVEVYYDAITLKMVGYKERQKDYIKINKGTIYLKINQSILHRIMAFGYESRYINIKNIFEKNKKIFKDDKKNYYFIINTLISDHIYKTKSFIDKISSFISKIFNRANLPSESEKDIQTLYSSKNLDKLIDKYSKLIYNFKIDDIFNDWGNIRQYFIYEKVNLETTTVLNEIVDYNISYNTINYYDKASSTMMYYTIGQLTKILESTNEKLKKNNICQMLIDIFNYNYYLYNVENIKNTMEIKRFEYVMNATSIAVDLLKKGQGLEESKEIDEQEQEELPPEMIQQVTEEEADELEDIREAEEAIDIETPEYLEDNEDYEDNIEYDEA